MTRQMLSAAAVVLAQFVTPSADAQAARDIRLALSADRSTYYVGEPVRLALAVHNDSEQSVSGYFRLTQAHESTRLFMRRGGQPYSELDFWKPDAKTEKLLEAINILNAPATVAPKRESRSERQIITRPRSGALVLDGPGDYEFFIECQVSVDGQPAVLRSETVHIEVMAAPAQHQQALSDYVAKGLPALLRHWPLVARLTSQTIADAASFLDQHPHGPYSDPVRKALVLGLQNRIRGKEASEADVELFEKLKDTVPNEHPANDPEGSIKRTREAIERRKKGSSF